jgi:hypothetical protein
MTTQKHRVYLFSYSNGIYMSLLHPRKTHPGSELLSTFHRIEDCVEYCARHNIMMTSLTKKTHTSLRDVTRQRLRDMKIGVNNPNFGGITREHREKIREAMRVRRGEHHHFYNAKHTSRSKLKISLSMRKLPPRRWMLSPEGTEHFMYTPCVLPPGWTWGRKRVR